MLWFSISRASILLLFSMWIIGNSSPPPHPPPHLTGLSGTVPPPSAHVTPTILLSITAAILVNTLPFAAHAANPVNASSWAVREGGNEKERERERDISDCSSAEAHTASQSPGCAEPESTEPLFTRRILAVAAHLQDEAVEPQKNSILSAKFGVDCWCFFFFSSLSLPSLFSLSLLFSYLLCGGEDSCLDWILKNKSLFLFPAPDSLLTAAIVSVVVVAAAIS